MNAGAGGRDDRHPRSGAGAEPVLRPRPPAPVSSESLFAGATEIQIVHRGDLYRLKQTALGKLILTK